MANSQVDWVSLAIAAMTAASVVIGKLLSNRAKRRTDQTEEGLAALEWAKEFEARTQRAEARSQQAEERNAENERRLIRMERKLAKGEEAAEALVELVGWTSEVIDLTHDPDDPDHRRLLRKIDGGPPAYHRHR